MTESQLELYRNIQAFDIDGGPAKLTFARRLARENGWSAEYTARVLDEYRKFLFLAMTSPHKVSPSEDVDQAWHLHMIYTDSYWNRLVGEVLPFPLHHGPTRGGQAEGAKYEDMYAKSLDRYRESFGEPPPEIWPSPKDRFKNASKFQRVNTAENWVISKPRLKRTATMALGVSCGAIGLTGCGAALAQSSSSMLPIFVILGLGGIGIVLFIIAMASRGAGGAHDPRRNDTSGTYHTGSGCGSSGCGSSGHSGHGHHGDSSDGGSDSGGSGDSGGGGGDGGSGCGGGGCGGGGCSS